MLPCQETQDVRRHLLRPHTIITTTAGPSGALQRREGEFERILPAHADTALRISSVGGGVSPRYRPRRETCK